MVANFVAIYKNTVDAQNYLKTLTADAEAAESERSSKKSR